MTAVPNGLARWRGVPGGSAWLRELPELIETCAHEWQLSLGPPFEPATISWVAPAEREDGTRAVLKINFPDPESEHEADALAWWAGDGVVRLLEHDTGRRALLLERCEPGTPLWDVSDERSATRNAAQVLRRLWWPAPADHRFRRLHEEAARWAEELPRRWERHGHPCSRRVLEEAVSLCADLVASQPDLVVCHQDFHGGNVLSSDRGWLAIDPKPLVGERAFDLASLLRDRRDALRRLPAAPRMVRDRLDLLTDELEVDRDRARGWGIVHALAWGLEEDAVHPDIVACAELIAAA